MTDSPSQGQDLDYTLRVAPEHGRDAALGAARIWARATARRDQLPRVPLAEDKLPGIEGALSHEGAQLLVARNQDAPVAFAVLVPRVAALEVLYLAVDPSAWSQGVAGLLLDCIRRQGEAAGAPLELWVIADNDRAISSYERAGWTKTADVMVRNSSGRPERRYTLSH